MKCTAYKCDLCKFDTAEDELLCFSHDMKMVKISTPENACIHLCAHCNILLANHYEQLRQKYNTAA